MLGRRQLSSLWVHRVIASSLFVFASVSALAEPQPPDAAAGAGTPSAGFAAGDLAVSGFSGITLSSTGLAPGIDPADKTIIDTTAPSLRVFDLSAFGRTPAGQVQAAPVKLAIPSADIGQVFALAIDQGNGNRSPALFAAATSYYGLQIVAGAAAADGTPVRLTAGAPGARFMAGQFGGLPGAGPGTIYRIDGMTGARSVFATIDGNSGAGLSALAFDPETRSLYVADLDSGLIRRVSVENPTAGASQFDHGLARTSAEEETLADDGARLDLASPSFKPGDPQTWGLTQPGRRVTALAVHDGRIVYAVAEGPHIWSVAQNPDGTFGTDVRRETTVAAQTRGFITAIAFDPQGRMLVAMRGAARNPTDFSAFVEPNSGRVLRFDPRPAGATSSDGRWAPAPQEYAVGESAGHLSSTGGLALMHAAGPDGTIDRRQCGATLVTTGDGLANAISETAAVHGVQINPANLVKPANTPPSQASTFIDFDGRLGNAGARGHTGAVATFQVCGGEVGPAIADGAPVAGESGPPGMRGPSAGGGAPMRTPGTGGAPAVAGGMPRPPVEETSPAETPQDENANVDPNAPNLALKKTQECTVDNPANPTKGTCTYNIALSNTGSSPFLMPPGGILDRVTGATPQISPSPGVNPNSIQPNGLVINFNKASLVPPGQPSPGLPVTMSFDIPPGGTTIENCATLVLPQPQPTPSPATLADKAKARASASPQISVEQGPLKKDRTPGCEPDGEGRKFCQWILSVSNPSSDFKGSKASFTSSIAPTNGFGAAQFGQNGIPATATGSNTTFEVVADIPEGSSIIVVAGHFPDPGPDPTLTAMTTEFGTPTDPLDVELRAGLQQASVDSNPSDNTSCVAFNTNKPDDQGTPTNEPTLGPPITLDTPDVAPPPTSPSTPEGKVTVTKTGVPTCKNSSGCEFTIQIKNDGTEPIAGPITLEERVKVNGSFFDSTKLTSPPPAPWTCGPMAEVMSCTHPGPLAAGETQEVKLTFAPSSEKELSKSIENCATAVGLAPPVCATTPVEADPPPPPPNLVITKLKQGGGTHCDVHGPCVFHIVVTNTGESDFVGPLTVKEFLPGAVFIPSGGGAPVETTAQSMRIIAGSSPGWDCQKKSANEMDCSQAGVVIPPKQFLSLLVEIVPGDSWKNAQTNELENCAILSSSSGSGKSCKTVKLDPFDVAVVKTGGQSCRPGMECTFNLDIFNPGNIPHDDPVTVTDKLTGIGAAPIVSLTAASGADPFPCSPPPTQAPFTCTGHMKLDVGEHNNYTVVIRIPDDAPQTGSFTNCAGVTQPGRESGAGAEGQSCHPVSLDPPKLSAQCPANWTGTYPDCNPPTTGGPNSTRDTPTAAAPICANGLTLTASGQCTCLPPAYWTGTQCLTPASPPVLTGGPNSTQSPADFRPLAPRAPPATTGRPTGGTNNTVNTGPPTIDTRRFFGGSASPPPTGGMNSTRNPNQPTDTRRFLGGNASPPTTGGRDGTIPSSTNKRTPPTPTPDTAPAAAAPAGSQCPRGPGQSVTTDGRCVSGGISTSIDTPSGTSGPGATEAPPSSGTTSIKPEATRTNSPQPKPNKNKLENRPPKSQQPAKVKNKKNDSGQADQKTKANKKKNQNKNKNRKKDKNTKPAATGSTPDKRINYGACSGCDKADNGPR